jgi:biotin carboxylase
VDPFSTGASLAAYIYSLGYKVIAIYSANMEQLSTMKNLIPQNLILEFDKIITFDDGVEGISAALRRSEYNLIAVLAGAETGVPLADELSSYLGLRTNGVDLSLARRNKYHMGETIRKAGVRAVKQLQASTWGEIAVFLKEWNPEPFVVVVKPLESAGSEDVTLCRSVTDVQDAFGHIMGKVNGLGLLNEAVLVQEYLSGQEYVVDMVSRDGEHKAVALWQCDKRPVNGASFVLYGQKMLSLSEESEEDGGIFNELISYQKTVLDALGIKNGPSHAKIKWCDDEPVLIEVGAHCHDKDGKWVDIAVSNML